MRLTAPEEIITVLPNFTLIFNVPGRAPSVDMMPHTSRRNSAPTVKPPAGIVKLPTPVPTRDVSVTVLLTVAVAICVKATALDDLA
jgi:hypothetical protein